MDPKSIDFAAMPQTAINVITKPAEFFQGMSKTGGFLEPLVFAVIMAFIAGIIHAVLGLFGAGYGGGMTGGLGMIIIMPIAAAIGSFIGAAIMFVIWKLVGSQEDYETAYRCGAYLMALAPITAVISVIPYAGGLVNTAIYVYFIVMASIYVHNIPSQKAWLVFGIIGVVFALLGVFGEYKARNMASSIEGMAASTEEMRRQAQEMAEQYRQQAERAQRQAE
ncbi:MAG: YIP1 family protein [Smithellaceae bacterium]